MSARRREKDIIAQAEADTGQLLDQIPLSLSVRRTNAERIVTLCREFVQQRPSREPTSPALGELGRIRFGRFPAKQTLLNGYRPFLRIWRKAHFDLISAFAPNIRSSQSFLDPNSLRNLDAGTRAQIDQLQILLKEQKLENDRLRRIISQTIPAPVPGTPADGPVEQPKLVHRWLRDLDGPNNALSVDEAGIRITRFGRPGRIVMDVNVFDSLAKLAGFSRPGTNHAVE